MGSKGSGYRTLSAFMNVWHLSASLEGETPQWMTTGRTVLIWKDKSKGNEASKRTKGYYQKSGNDAEGSQRTLRISYTQIRPFFRK